MNSLNIDFSLLFDPLSLFFLAVILLISIPSAIYSVGYMRGEYGRGKTFFGWLLLFLFIASMLFVVTVKNGVAFLVAWEVMSLASYFFVVFDSGHEKAVRAGTIYIVMTHIGTAFITAAFLIMYVYAGSLDFGAFKAASHLMPPRIKDIVFLLLLAGFGTKAGIVPLHVWLPYAHPQAPSHISSIMSGVMIKTAIYGMLRFIVFTLGVSSVWWGNIILVLAAISCIVGVMYALMEHDLKKLLAYHSVENIGIILLGIGGAIVFIKMNMPFAAVLSMSAGLYHLVNHAIFKGLLFLAAGSVYKATGIRNIEKLGGLIKLMPWTAASFLLGSMAISAIVPLNGFVSEWLTLQAFFAGALGTAGGYKIFMAVMAAVLALTGGLAAACFVKAFGITFLAMPRSERASEAKESPLSMKIALLFLSLLTIVFGIGASFILRILAVISGHTAGINTSSMSFALNNFVIIPQGTYGGVFMSPSLVALVLLLVTGSVALGLRLGTVKNKVTTAKTWDCGYYKLTSRTEYTATAFSKPFRIAFSFFLLPYKKTEKIRDSFYHIKSFKYELFTTPVFKRYIYEPILALTFGMAEKIKKIQPGSIHIYIAYILITIVSLIIILNRY